MNKGRRPRKGLNEDLSIEEVALDSPMLESVIKLHAAGKSKLGPFPRGAFEDHARQKSVLAGIAKDGSVAGYLFTDRKQHEHL